MNGQFHPLVAYPRNTMERRLCGPHSQCGLGDDEKNFCPYLESNADRPAVA